ncbi:hypothetical protein HPULCUR_000112 [Helicostylum pulchrum]|uniref:ER transporter 6TM N-terminal domain-containing protein n=1 Tax=Helicostylum pulchrum TaxID=562976 RepID=A0ABP9XIY1_9FUNG
MADFSSHENRSRFFDLAYGPTVPAAAPTPTPPRVRLQNMFQVGEEEESNDETATTSTSSERNKRKLLPDPTLDGHIPKPKSKVQFPIDLEHRFYHLDPKPPMEEEEAEDLPVPPPSRKERVLAYLHLKFPSRIVRRVIKCTVAYFLTALLSLIRPVSQAIGPGVIMSTTGMLFSHPGRSMGAQFDATVTSVLGVVCAVLYAFAGLAASVAYNVANPETYISEPTGRVINGLFLFVGVFGAQMLRQVFPKFHFFSMQFMIIQIFAMTRGINNLTIPYQLPLNYGVPLLIGHGISLFVNLVFWPETAVDGLGRALKETITSSRDMLHMITKQFFLDPQSDPVAESVVDAAAENMRKGMTKVKTAYREAKYEMSYAFIRPQQLGQVRKSLGRLTKHLSILGGCLQSERELFESALEALQSEMFDLDSDEDADSQGQGYHSDTDEAQHPPRPSYSEEDLNLLRTALRATNEYMSGSKYSSRQPSAAGSPRSSRAPSRANSRPASAHNSEDEDVADQNQRSVSSLKSFLNLPRLSIPKQKPPKKTKKQTEYHHRHLLMTYLESLRDPLMELSLECSNALECVCESIIVELDMDDESLIESTWKAFLSHTFNIGKKPVVSDQKAQERHKGNKCNCSQNIRLAIIQFDKAERERMHALYEINKARMGHEALDLGMRQELFLVFFFIFTMREVSNELQEMTLHMDELRLYSRKASFKGKKRRHFYWPVFDTRRWGKWAKGNNHQSVRDKGGYTFSALTTHIPKDDSKKKEPADDYKLTKLQTEGSLKRTKSRKGSKPFIHEPNNEADSPTMLRLRRPFSEKISDSKPRDIRIEVPQNYTETDEHPEKEVTEEKAPIMLRIRYTIWLKLQFCCTYEFKFALKMAAAVLSLCMPAFIPNSVDWYSSVRGQWAPMTVIAIMNPTSGGTLEASFWRIIGTLVGAFTGWAALAAGDNSPYLLALFAVLLAIPFFYIHLASTYNKVGIVCLTTYMVVALSRYAYPIPGETIESTVWKRTATVIVGVCVALLLNSLIWPFVARYMVRKSIAVCLGHLEDYYTYIMGTFLYHDPDGGPTDAEITRGEKLESKIQSAIDACSVLLDLTDHEPRFRGPFAKLFYKEMIVSMRNLLDRMLSTRIALLKMPVIVKQDICAKDYHVDRRDMVAAMLLTFHTLASSLRSKTPLPAYMPSARAARSKLMNHRRAGADKTNWVRFRNLTWFAMACSSEEIIEELEYLTDLIRYIVGETEYADRAKRIDDFVCTK